MSCTTWAPLKLVIPALPFFSAQVTAGERLESSRMKTAIYGPVAETHKLSVGICKKLICIFFGQTFQLGEDWYSNEKAGRFWHPQSRVQKVTASRCYA